MDLTERRKMQHIQICIEKEVETGDPLFDEVTLVHQALTDLNLEWVDCSQTFLGKRLEFPLLIAAMTGGCREAEEINLALAGVAARKGVAFGVGSQRAMIENPDLTRTFEVRGAAPDILLLGNIGITALRKVPLLKIHRAVRDIGADALCVHVNPAQELFQKEGDLDFSGCTQALRDLCRDAGYPVIAKEVGNGISRESARGFQECGVQALDLGGVGGTSWVLVDSIRSGKDSARFRSWGIPTAASILEARGTGLPLIATGGVRNGLQMAKAVALGADLCGIALPFIQILDRQGVEGVERYVDTLKREFCFALYLTGAASIQDFRKRKPVLGPRIVEWIRQRGLSGL
jgi:isopentenyl-diphosphate Delta-isomerase